MFDVEATMTTLYFAEQTGRIKNHDGVLSIKKAVVEQTETKQHIDFDFLASLKKIKQAVDMITSKDVMELRSMKRPSP